jgi:putative heme-binding domain-containing protein
MHSLIAVFGAIGIILVTGLGASQAPPPLIAPTEPRTAEEELKGLHVPPGFIVQLVAKEPKVKKPINIAFDAMGRLWVTESIEYPFPAPSGRKGKDTVKILDDFGPDGEARKITTFADGLNIPIGVLPMSDGAMVYSIPNIYYMTAKDGKADRREVLLSTYGFGDTHGMTGEFMHGFDGWIYACHGFANTSKVKGKGPNTITMTSGNTYRFKPDGSRVEHFTHGQVNPFGLTFDPLGNLYSCDCHSRPIYQLLRGAYYPSFGRPHDGLGFGPEMLQHDHGSTAIAGITYYAAEQFPKEYRDNIFIGNVVTNRINRDRLEKHGSTYKAIEMPDFLKSDDPWFRPVDIKLGPDGALYVADFYNRIIGHYEVDLKHPGRDRTRGRIWRIVYRGDDKKPLPAIEDLTRLDAEALIARLDSPNLSARMQAMHVLVSRGGNAVVKETTKALANGSAFQQAHGLWILERLGSLAIKELKKHARSKSHLVRVHVMRIVAERARWSKEEHALAVAGLNDVDAFVQRTAADALGRHPEAGNIAHLLEMRHKVPTADSHLLHVVRMALRDTLIPAGTLDKLPTKSWSQKDSRASADVCLGLRSAESAAFLLGHINRWREAKEPLADFGHHIARHGAAGSAKDALKLVREKYKDDLQVQAALFQAVQRGLQERGASLGDLEKTWAKELVLRLIGAADLQTGIDLAGSLRLEAVADVMANLAGNANIKEAQRRSAITALVSIQPKKSVGVLGRMLLNPEEPVGVREQAAVALAGANLPEAHAELLKALESSPAAMQKVIALGLAGSQQGARVLLDAVAAGKASARLLVEQPIETRLRQTNVPQLARTLAKLTRGLPKADERLHKLLTQRSQGYQSAKTDPVLGAKLFQTHCGNCHQIKNQGAKLGPQLDGIGGRGLERLLEDILDPNRNVDQAFRSTVLNLKDGKLVSGLFLRQEGKILVLADDKGKEVRIPEDTVERRALSPQSPMPGNFAEQISERDFYHLLAYLLPQRAK